MDKEPPALNNEQISEKVKRPFLVTVLAVLVLIMASIHLIRFIEALSQWRFLSGLPRVSPTYLAISGLFWFLIGLPLVGGLWRGYPEAPKATRIIALSYSIYYWLDRLLLESAEDKLVNWPFAAGLTLVFLILIMWVFSRPSSKVYFGEIHA